ncbi:MAG: HzsA-related protein [Planctomycetota bacterium]
MIRFNSRSTPVIISTYFFIIYFSFSQLNLIAIASPQQTSKERSQKVDTIVQNLLDYSREIRLKEQLMENAAIEEANIKLGRWYCIGPFKHEFKGIHFDAFNTVFGPEEHILKQDRDLVNLEQTWEVQKFPGIIETTLQWHEKPDWNDGYRCELPMGPPPALNETNYVYRTISTSKDINLDMEIIAEDDVRVWLNGDLLGQAYPGGGRSSCRMPAGLRRELHLKAGENRLLIKITTMFGARSFSFAVPAITVHNEIWPYNVVKEQREGIPTQFESINRFYPGNEPFSIGLNQTDKEIDERYRHHLEKKDGISKEMTLNQLYELYVSKIMTRLGLPEKAKDILSINQNSASLETIKQTYYEVSKYSDALKRLKEFNFDVPVTPMYDPPNLKMHQIIDEYFPDSSEGSSYLNRLDGLKLKVSSALEKAEKAEPGSLETVIEASEAIQKMWSDVISSLGPIVFYRSSRYFTNTEAIAPYIPDGETPANICIYDSSDSKNPVKVVYNDPDGAILDMNLSYDAKTIFFSAKPKAGIRGNWDIYEIGIDGKNLRRITYNDRSLYMGSEGERFYDSNISPVELPNGEIMFVSTRSNTYVNCQTNPAGFLYVCNRDGSNVRRVSGNTESDHKPQVLDDGRVVFTRWDYGVDKNVFVRQSLWTINPDGSRFQLFSGNTIENPNSFWNARAVPGKPAVVCVFGPHHNYHAGMIGMVWNYLGYEVPRGTGFRWITQELPLYDDITLPWGYRDPFPVNERLFLVSYGGDGGEKNRIYILDDRGNKKCIYEDPKLACFNPILARPRKKPPVIAPASEHTEYVYRDPFQENQDPKPQWGTFYLQDVYRGLEPHVKRGAIKSLAIMEQLPKTAYPAGGGQWGAVPVTGRGTMHVRRVVGIVPVESDGSAQFKAPAIRDISFNALDDQGRTIMKMGSPTQVMPGETIGCIGCHEHRHMAPPPDKYIPKAVQRPVSVPKEPDWGTNGIIDFVKVVQPVFDKHCISCHSGPSPVAAIDLSNDKTRLFNMAYNNLIDRGLVDYAMCNSTDHEETTPNSVGAIVSSIRQQIESDHCGYEIPLEDRQRIYYWIDASVPYYGTYTFTNPNVGRRRWYTREREGWYQAEFMPVFNRRCVDCHSRKIKTQAYNYRRHDPQGAEVTVTSKIWTDYAQREWFSGDYAFVGPCHRINLTNPEWSQMLTAPLAEEAGGLGLCKNEDETPVFADKSDADYKRMLQAFKKASQKLTADPRVDMLSDIPPISRTSMVGSDWD